MRLTSIKSKVDILADTQFRTFFIGSSVSKIGDGLIPVAFSLFAYQISGSASGIASVLISLWATRFVTVPLGGRVADQYSRLAIALAADIVRLIAQCGLAVVMMTILHVHIWH